MALDQFPEELLDRIVFFLRHQSSLAAAALTSRKLNRIATPYLYTAISLTATRPGKTVLTTFEDPMASNQAGARAGLIHAKYDSISLDKCNMSHFISTIIRRPDLRQHVQYLELLRQDSGCVARAAGSRRVEGLLHVSELIREARGSVFDRESLRPATISDPVREAVQAVLRMLPNVQCLDCSGYHTDIPAHAVLDEIGPRTMFPTNHHCFGQLRHFKLDCKTESFFTGLHPLFTLPNLESLCLLRLQLNVVTATIAEARVHAWERLVPSRSIIKMEISGVVYDTLSIATTSPSPNVAPMGMLFFACERLKSLTVTTPSAGLQRVLHDSFGQYLSTIENLDIREID